MIADEYSFDTDTCPTVTKSASKVKRCILFKKKQRTNVKPSSRWENGGVLRSLFKKITAVALKTHSRTARSCGLLHRHHNGIVLQAESSHLCEAKKHQQREF